ncbi:MAG: amidophosphoribosyltransferase [Armatimonadetes bacterium]|nr:amidophosphoribosyltransferase [Armatimonadota bacterium]MDW8152610.1 amidophosphoribosyltransferase [Armatimonadota bacterium]
MTDRWREECGVFGVALRRGAAAPFVYTGLLALQHRGQESAGIATHDGAALRVQKGMGLVSEVFRGDPTGLEGSVGIGHVRYSTMGSAILDNAQPVVVPSPWGPVAVAHNGNLTNAPQLRAELEARGAVFRTTSDTEVIALSIATAPVASVEEAIRTAMVRLEGAFTVTALAGGVLFAFRDQYGIRPLVLGQLEEGWVVASETCALDSVGATYVRDVHPGELVAFEGDEARAEQVLPGVRPASCVFEFIYFARPDTVLRGRTVHEVRRRMGRVLAREHPAEADVVIPVPDSGTSAALGYAEQSGLPLELGLVKNRYVGRTFIEPDPARRAFGVRTKLSAIRAVVAGRRVVLVDDSIVRGTTSARLVHALREAGAREVHLRISSPPIRWPCFYGVDTSSRGQLVAARLDVEGIRREIGADSLGYLSQEGLVAAIGLPGHTLCMACLDGRYPTPAPTESEAGKYALERR